MRAERRYVAEPRNDCADLTPHQRGRYRYDIHYRFIDERMSENDELTSVKLHAMLKEKVPDVSVKVLLSEPNVSLDGWQRRPGIVL